MINYNKLINNLETLKLDKMVTYLPNYLKSIEGKDISLTDFLYELTQKEIEFRAKSEVGNFLSQHGVKLRKFYSYAKLQEKKKTFL